MLCTPFGLIKENLQPYNFIEVEGGSSPVVDSTEFMAWTRIFPLWNVFPFLLGKYRLMMQFFLFSFGFLCSLPNIKSP